MEENKEIIRRVFEEVVNQGNLVLIDALFAANFVDRSAFPGQTPGPAGIKEAVRGLRAMFPDLEVTIEDLIAEDNRVASRETWQGTHTSGRAVLGTVIHIFHFSDGRIAEEWSRGWDWLSEFEM
jgi:predicted ester cyclase